MKKLSLIGVIALICIGLSLVSCSDDDEKFASAKLTTGIWYLVSFDGNHCDWGEYIKFSGNTMYWNNRLGGENTTYSFKNTPTGFKCTSKTSGYGDVAYIAVEYSNNEMVTYPVDGGNTRLWRR